VGTKALARVLHERFTKLLSLEGGGHCDAPVNSAVVKRLAAKPLLLDVDTVIANLDSFQGKADAPSTPEPNPERSPSRRPHERRQPSARLQMIRGVVNETCSDINDPENSVEDYASLLKIIGVSLAIGAAGGQLIGRATQALIASVKRRIGRQPAPEVINRVTEPQPDPWVHEPGPGEPRHTETYSNMSAQADEGMRAATRARNERVQPRVYMSQEDAFGPSHEHAEPSWYRGPTIGVPHAYGVAPPAPSQEEIYDFAINLRNRTELYAAEQLLRPSYYPEAPSEPQPSPVLVMQGSTSLPVVVRNGQDFRAGGLTGCTGHLPARADQGMNDYSQLAASSASGLAVSTAANTMLTTSHAAERYVSVTPYDNLWHRDHECLNLPTFTKSRRRPCLLCGNASGPSCHDHVTITPGGEIWPSVVTVTPGGEVWHKDFDCRAMLNAVSKSNRKPCPRCVNG
jgi:hypothetical protein